MNSKKPNNEKLKYYFRNNKTSVLNRGYSISGFLPFFGVNNINRRSSEIKILANSWFVSYQLQMNSCLFLPSTLKVSDININNDTVNFAIMFQSDDPDTSNTMIFVHVQRYLCSHIIERFWVSKHLTCIRLPFILMILLSTAKMKFCKISKPWTELSSIY